MRQTLEGVASELRAMALATSEGELIGTEDLLVARLGAARATIRQAARLLEREGLLTVRRGLNGGYFASRPSLDTVEAVASAYLQSIHVNPKHVNMIASTLWTEVVREAALLQTKEARTMASAWVKKIESLPSTLSLIDIVELEQKFRTELFATSQAGYVELIFHINSTLGARGVFTSPNADEIQDAKAFRRNWCGAKLGELRAILDGDVELAAIAARHTANLLQGEFTSPGRMTD